MTKLLKIVFPLLLIIIMFSCKDDFTQPSIRKYIHISHTRTDSNPFVYGPAEVINYNLFEMKWLGGDLAYLTTLDNRTMRHIDSVFDVGSNNTLWALGNHDYSDLEKYQEFTNRPPFYTYTKDGICFVVLDTQDSLGHIIGQQKELLDQVIDTIQHSSHLILLHHKLIWMYDDPILEPQIPSVSNGILGDCFHCINENNFNRDIYPSLVEVRQRGIEVICIGGDIGNKIAEFEYTTPESIYLLASGISTKRSDNKALVFVHNIENRELSWSFRLLEDLR